MINNSMFCKKHSQVNTDATKKYRCTCLIENSVDLDPKFNQIVNDNFWELLSK